ncbi:MAG: crosslink repair DNA glycosylase YcaQ family protein [Acidobacteriota bacterium]
MTETLSVRQARRLALARAGLLKPEWTGLPKHARGGGPSARRAALAVVERFGYLQLDTVSIAGARSHAIVLLSRLRGLDPKLPEELLRPGEPLFEYWGHEASWIPLGLYPAFAFRRREYAEAHPWWGDLLREHSDVARRLLDRIEREGPLRSADFEGSDGGGWWRIKETKKVATALWSAGRLAVAERRGFQRVWDLVDRVIPEASRGRDLPLEGGLETLLLRALEGFGWATPGTLAATWRLRNLRPDITAALGRLEERGEIQRCDLLAGDRRVKGWVRPADLEMAAWLDRLRPRRDRGVLLSPFDPLLWDRGRVRQLFDFDQTLEIFKPAPARVYGYYCLPVLAGERLVGRVDLKAERRSGELRVLQHHFESERPSAAEREACATALARYAAALELDLVGDLV